MHCFARLALTMGMMAYIGAHSMVVARVLAGGEKKGELKKWLTKVGGGGGGEGKGMDVV